jgi:hypothetical protein
VEPPTLTKIIVWFLICSAAVLAFGLINIWFGIFAVIVAVPFYRAVLYG